MGQILRLPVQQATKTASEDLRIHTARDSLDNPKYCEHALHSGVDGVVVRPGRTHRPL